MNGGERILLTAATTIMGGVIVFVLGQVTSRFFIEPWYEQRKVVGSIAEALLNYEHLFVASGDPLPSVADAAQRLRQLSDMLVPRTVAVPCYRVLSGLGLAPGVAAISEASRGLVGLSNTLHRSDWEQKSRLANQVRVSLRLDRLFPGPLGKAWAQEAKNVPGAAQQQ